MSSTEEPVIAEIVPDAPPPNTMRDVANNVWALYALLFLVTGVLGIPLIFYSTKLGTVHKWVLAIAVTIYTASLILGVYAILVWCWNVVSNSL